MTTVADAAPAARVRAAEAPATALVPAVTTVAVRPYGGPRSNVPGREFADRPRDPNAQPMAPKTTERIHDGDDFAFGKIEF